jgi:hypothetical protein
MTDAIAKLNALLGKVLAYGPPRKSVERKKLKNGKKIKRSKNRPASA